MALPTLRKTWQFATNQVGSAIGGDNGQLQLLVSAKNAMTSFPILPWTVVGSSDGSAWGIDAVDRWVTFADVALDSWIVLEQPATGLQVCMFMDRFGGAVPEAQMSAYMSAADGFTGGGATTRPTATDEIELLPSSGEEWAAANTSSSSSRVHALHSDDGLFTYVVTTMNFGLAGLWFFGQPLDTDAAWADPVIACMINPATYGYQTVFYPTHIKGNLSGASLRGAMEMTALDPYGVPTPVGDALGAVNDLTGKWPITDIEIYSDTTPVGEHASMPDLWLVAGAIADGDRMPSDGSGQFVAFTTFLFPWDGSTVLLD